MKKGLIYQLTLTNYNTDRVLYGGYFRTLRDALSALEYYDSKHVYPYFCHWSLIRVIDNKSYGNLIYGNY